MNIQRMKFAWARGAQFQHQHVGDKEWRDLPRACCPEYEDADRIHPNDAHLEYGPLSSALREWAMFGYDTERHPERDAAEAYFNWRLVIEGLPDPRFASLVGYHRTTPEEWFMFRLLMAELLADEGL